MEIDDLAELERELEQVKNQFYEFVGQRKSAIENPHEIAELGQAVGRFEMKYERAQRRLDDAKRRKEIRNRLIQLRDSTQGYGQKLEEAETIVEIAESDGEVYRILESLV